MSWLVPSSQRVDISPIQWAVLSVNIVDIDRDNHVILNQYQAGNLATNSLAIKHGQNIKLPLDFLPNFVTLIGCKSDDSKAYIAFNVDLTTAAVLNIYGVDESGAGGNGEGDRHVAGTVRIDGNPVERSVMVISDDPITPAVLAIGSSDGSGVFDIAYSDWDGGVIVLAMDHYGQPFPAETPLNMGEIVHPTTPNGYVYQVTASGLTGASEPTWPTSGAVISGSVTFAAQAYYRPVASGPLVGAEL